ncbi:MAG: hypothetical protein K6F37_00075 [Lachnospiraceae bacterium]|nr:hypothetical protein [Lachnospiraceae bacterium]
MPIKPIGFITNNFGLKILAILISVAIWMIVVNVDDPKITRNFTAPVTIENASYLTDQNKWYEISDDDKTVTFSVSGKRSYLEKMSSSDFRAVANFESIDGENKVPIDITVLSYANNVTVSSKNRYLTLNVEDLVSQPFVVTVQTTGDVADGYALGDTSVSPSILRVTGPESVMEKISKVVATVEVDGISSSITDSVTPVLYDESGNEIEKDDLTFNVSNILVSVGVLNTKELPVEVNVTASADDGYEISNISISPESLAVKGEYKVLKKINSLSFGFGDSDIDLTGVTDKATAYIDISGLLPEGVSLVSADDSTLAVTVEVVPLVTKTFEVSTDNITVEGISSGYKTSFEDETVSVDITGTEEDINALSASDITGVVDASELAVGESKVEVEWNLDDDKYYVEDEITVKLRIVLNNSRG